MLDHTDQQLKKWAKRNKVDIDFFTFDSNSIICSQPVNDKFPFEEILGYYITDMKRFSSKVPLKFYAKIIITFPQYILTHSILSSIKQNCIHFPIVYQYVVGDNDSAQSEFYFWSRNETDLTNLVSALEEKIKNGI